jgi:hypothetical protein
LKSVSSRGWNGGTPDDFAWGAPRESAPPGMPWEARRVAHPGDYSADYSPRAPGPSRARLPGGRYSPAWPSGDASASGWPQDGWPQDLGDPGYEFDPPRAGQGQGWGTEWDVRGWRGSGTAGPRGAGGYPRAPGTDGFDAVRDTGGFPASSDYHAFSGGYDPRAYGYGAYDPGSYDQGVFPSPGAPMAGAAASRGYGAYGPGSYDQGVFPSPGAPMAGAAASRQARAYAYGGAGAPPPRLPLGPRPSPGRAGLSFRQEIVRAMRARNLVTGLAIPILAAIAVGIAVVVAAGANNGRGGTAPSQLSAGYPPARIATADFTGKHVAVSAIAASGATQVAAGSAAGNPALWFSRDGGSTWARGTGTTPGVLRRAGSQQVRAVADGPAGWVAVGGSAGLAPGHPLVVGSADGGRRWSARDGAAGFAAGNLVTASVAADRAGGYAIVGWQASGGHVTAMAWYSAGLSGWRRALVPAGGDSRLASVTATSGGFVAAGSSGGRPAAWVSRDGKAWRQVTLALPGSAVRAALEHVAANGSTVAATGTAVAASGARVPFAEMSADGGASWEYGDLPSPGGAGSLTVTALTAAGSGFTAAGTFGAPGGQDVVIWARGPGDGAWMAATPAGNGLSGPGIQQITALSSGGSTLTGAGFTAATPQAALPTLWQSPIRG